MTGAETRQIPLWRAALTSSCPRCGKGGLYATFLGLKDQCDVCHLPLARADSGDGPAVLLTFALGFILVPPILLFSLTVEWPLWLHAIIWSVVVMGATMGAVRPAKALLVAVQYRTRPHAFENAP